MHALLVAALMSLAFGSGATNSDAKSFVLAPGRLLVSGWTSTTSDLRADWKTFGNGPSHTGYFPDTVSASSFAPEWTTTLAGNLQQVAVAEGRVFVTPWQYFSSAWLTALDESNGVVLWTYPFEECFSINPPTFDAGHVYVQRGDHGSDTQLWSFHADSGVPYWLAAHSAQWERYMAPTVADGKVWVNGGYYGGMYGFQQSNGQQLFFQGLAQYDGWTPTYFAGALYSWVEGVLRSHDRTSGATQWSVNTSWSWAGWTMGRTSAIANGRAFVIGNPKLYAIDLTSRTTAWTVSGNFTGTPAVANGVVYAISGGAVNAYDAWSGAYLGAYVGAAGLQSQPIVTDDAVLCASGSKTFAFDRQSFLPLATINYGGLLSLANGRLYVATATGQLRTFQAVSGSSAKANLVAEWEPWVGAGGPPNHYATRVAITNFGSMASNEQRVVFALSTDTSFDAGDVVLRGLKLLPMAVGETLTATVELKVDPSSSGKYLLIVPDADDQVPETNESNCAPSSRLP